MLNQPPTDILLNFRQATFLKSAPRLAQCPEDKGVEIACIGRSNSGKSSLINTLCEQSRLAKTSKTPGRTQLINFYEITPEYRLVDLPGYGYAKVSEKTKEQIQLMLTEYLSNRGCLRGLIVIMDIRHPLTPSDQQLIDLATELNLSMHIVLTKCDKLNRGPANQTLLKVQQMLSGLDNITVQTFSAQMGYGLEALQDKLSAWFSLPQ
jgi:GTP-binding protein